MIIAICIMLVGLTGLALAAIGIVFIYWDFSRDTINEAESNMLLDQAIEEKTEDGRAIIWNKIYSVQYRYLCDAAQPKSTGFILLTIGVFLIVVACRL